ncbi:hypothetical protein ACFL6S_15510, partial [Candidatus Poribacteria bacterium]
MRDLCYLLLAIGFLALVSGCGEGTDPAPQPLKVVSISPPGGYIASNAVITITFNNVMESVEVKVLDPPLHRCVKSVTTLQWKIATWHTTCPSILVPAEEVTLTVTGTDIQTLSQVSRRQLAVRFFNTV